MNDMSEHDAGEIPSKPCSRCGQVKRLNEFGVDNRRDNPKAICKVCDRELHRLRYYDPKLQDQIAAYRKKSNRWTMATYTARKKKGVCVACGDVADGSVYCDKHRAAHKDRQKMIRRNAREGRKCPGCLVAELGSRRRLCDSCVSTTSDHYRARQAEWRSKQKLIAFNAYGGAVCACCGESNFKFLTIDHVDGSGADHRRMIFSKTNGRGTLYRWLKRHHYPPGFRVLCFNCNCGREYNGGTCPHKDQK